MLYLVKRKSVDFGNNLQDPFRPDEQANKHKVSQDYKNLTPVRSSEFKIHKEAPDEKRRSSSQARNFRSTNTWKGNGLSQVRKKQLKEKFNFSNMDLEVYEKVWRNMRRMNEEEKGSLISFLLGKTN